MRCQPMNLFANAIELNIKRFQNLLDTSVDDAERQTIQALLAEEKAKAAELQPPEPEKIMAGRGWYILS